MRSAALGAPAAVVFTLAPAAASAHRQTSAPRNIRLPRVMGPKVVGRTLSATPGTWRGKPKRFRYTWQRCNSRGACGSVRGAHKRLYRLHSRDAGKRLRVVVTAWNAAGSASAASSPTGTIKRSEEHTSELQSRL